MQDAAGWLGGLPGDTAVRGAWTLDVPIGTDAEPSSEHSEIGRRCWFKGQGQIANNTDGDVDLTESGGPGSLPPRGSHRSGRARLTHPAPQTHGFATCWAG